MITKKLLGTILILVLFLEMPALMRAQDASKADNDFPVKGFHIDLRIQVMTPEALKDFAKQLSEFGMCLTKKF